MLAPSTVMSTGLWPIPNDAPDLQAIVQAGARTIADQAALIDAYQGVLNTNQTQTPAQASGSSSGGNQLTLVNVVGTILTGAVVVGAGVPSGTTITGQIGGVSGGNGTYTTSQNTSLSGVALSFVPGPMNWPQINDANSLMLISQQQTAMIRNQNALLQQYQDLLNTSGTPAPPSGP